MVSFLSNAGDRSRLAATNLMKKMLPAPSFAIDRLSRSPALRRLVFNAIRLERPEIARLRERADLRFLAHVFANRDRSRSQILQDLWVLHELREKRDGFFVEFGATDGTTNSNTHLLETDYGWTGIVCEPNPYWHERLAANRSCVVDRRCVSSKSGERVRFLTTNASDPELSAIAAFADGDHFSETRGRGVPIEVETVSLDDLLDLHGAPAEIDYLSVDTEGSEFDILSHFDFARRSIRLLSVEQNPRTERPIEALLAGHGYVRVFPEFSQWDGWYVRRA